MPSIPDHRPLDESTVLIVGTVRDCARHLADDVSRLGAAFDGARSIRWMLVESDSSDATLDVLRTLREREERFAFVSLGRLVDTIRSRTARIAHCRNAYVAAMRADDAFRDVDYVVVSDFDGVNARIDRQAIRSCWERSDWDVCAANQAGPYYDVYALRHPVWCPDDCLQQLAFHNRYHPDKRRNQRHTIEARMLRIPRDGDWISVDSAFGGLAIYRRQAFLDSEYVGLDARGDPVCEHVAFHAGLRALGYRIVINPRMINAVYTDHTRHLRSRLHELKDFVKCGLRTVGLRRGAR